MLPESTEVLIVGAGPAGLTSAISLALNGCKNITIIDAQEAGINCSRAIMIHAKTVEVSVAVVCVRCSNTHNVYRNSKPSAAWNLWLHEEFMQAT